MAKIRGTVALTLEVLAKTSREEMQSFYHWYLRHDPKAQLQFLARFSDKIDLDESEKYEWLFYKSIQLLRGSSAYLGLSKQKSLLKIFHELLSQASDALAVNHFVKTFYILSNGLVFIRLLNDKERSLHNGFYDIYDQYLKLFYQLLEADLPRDLIQRSMTFADYEINVPKPIIKNDYFTLLRLKIRMEYAFNGLEMLFDYIDEHWNSKSLKSAEKLAEFYFMLFTEPWASYEIDALQQLNLSREVWRIVLQTMQRNQMYKEMRLIWNKFELKHHFSNSRYKSLFKHLGRLNKTKKSSDKISAN